MRHLLWISCVFCIVLFPSIGEAKISEASSTSQPDTAPYIDKQSHRMMVPVRFISEQLGARVEWDAKNETVQILQGKIRIALKINQTYAMVNEKQVPLDAKAIIRDQSTFVPLRFISESLGADIQWIAEKNVVILKTKGKTIELKVSDKDQKAAVYENERFRVLSIEKAGDRYSITGEARVFKGIAGYIVEDGHYELVKGHVKASQAAPHWGQIKIDIEVKKVKENSTLMLILFEESAKDGKRRYELAVPLG